MLVPCWVNIATFVLFVASCGPRFFGHRCCIKFESFLNELVDRPFGDNLIFVRGLFAKNNDSRVPKLIFLFYDVPSTWCELLHNVWITWASFFNIFST